MHIRGEEEGGGERGVWRNLREEREEWCNNSKQHVAPCAKGVEWGLGQEV